MPRRDSRPKDWVDLEGVIVRQAGRIDWTCVWMQLAPLVELKEVPDILPRLDQRRQALDQ